MCQGRDESERQGIFRIDAESGEATPIVISPTDHASRLPEWSADGKKIFYVSGANNKSWTILERDLATGTERELYKHKDANYWGESLSPDGRAIAALLRNEQQKSTALLLIPVEGGEPRELLRVNASQGLGSPLAWVRDSSGVIVRLSETAGTPPPPPEFWFVPADAGKARKLDIAPHLFLGLPRVHPDGRQIAYVAGETKHEVLALESFLPPAKAVK